MTDRQRFDAAEFGLEVMSALHAQYPQQFNFARALLLVLNKATIDALTAGKDPHEIETSWEPDLQNFRARRGSREKGYLIYSYLPPDASKSVDSVETITVD